MTTYTVPKYLAVAATILVAVPGLGPTVTVRPLATPSPSSLGEIRFSLGDLELF